MISLKFSSLASPALFLIEAPQSKLYADLEGEQVGIDLMTTKNAEKLSCGHPDFFDWLDGSLMVFIDVFDGI
jgi:hypothetical protein